MCSFIPVTLWESPLRGETPKHIDLICTGFCLGRIQTQTAEEKDHNRVQVILLQARHALPRLQTEKAKSIIQNSSFSLFSV